MALDFVDVPDDVRVALRVACARLPEVYEEPTSRGLRWRVRKRTFADVIGVDGGNGPATVMTFRSSGPELEVLRRSPHPFFRPGWGSDVVGMVLDADTDWEEVAELLCESFRVLAPKKLVERLEAPE